MLIESNKWKESRFFFLNPESFCYCRREESLHAPSSLDGSDSLNHSGMKAFAIAGGKKVFMHLHLLMVQTL
jgi:hypothetical protein